MKNVPSFFWCFEYNLFSNLKSMIHSFSKKRPNYINLKDSRGKKWSNENETSTHVDNFNFVGLAGGEAARGEEAGTDKKKGKNGGILVHDRQCPSRG